MRLDRIYPVPVKPASDIGNWGKWPADVEATLRQWNRRRLSFRRSATGSIFEPTFSVFKCVDCEQFCEPHRHGAAVLDGDWLCDDCLIARARADNALRDAHEHMRSHPLVFEGEQAQRIADAARNRPPLRGTIPPIED